MRRRDGVVVRAAEHGAGRRSLRSQLRTARLGAMGVLVVLLIIIAVAVLYVVAQYNGLVKVRNRIENGWAQIDVQLKRRHDLIPNLVETVKGYAAHERSTLEAVIAARNFAMTASGVAGKSSAEAGLSGTLKNLFALGEAYPDLKANANFLNLQEELTGTEDKIAYARQYYNDEVRAYNTKIQSFPGNLFAKQFKFAEREYFEVGEAERGPVNVKF
jgi:LemA protein